MKKGVTAFVSEANAAVKTYSVADAVELVGEESVAFIDVRDENEIAKAGKVLGAVHASRGMLEFHIDPSSPFHKDIFASGKELVFYCGSGGRSVLAAHRAMEMGLENVAHVSGGFAAWTEGGGPVEKPQEE